MMPITRFAACWLLYASVSLAPQALRADATNNQVADAFANDMASAYTRLDCADSVLSLKTADNALREFGPCYHYNSTKAAAGPGRTRVDKAIGAVNHIRNARLLRDAGGRAVAVYHLRVQTMEMLAHKTLSKADMQMIFAPQFLPEGDAADSGNCAQSFRRLDKRRYLYAYTCSDTPGVTNGSLTDAAIKLLN